MYAMRLPRLGKLNPAGKPGGAENVMPCIKSFYFLMVTTQAACYTACMAAWRLKHSQNHKISITLIVALLFITIWPAHFHVHHANEDTGHGHSHGHKHIVDMHADVRDMDASHHQDAQVLKASPDGVLKTPLVKVLPFLLLAMVLAVVATRSKRLIKTYRRQLFIPTGYLDHHSPPLRGPPAIS